MTRVLLALISLPLLWGLAYLSGQRVDSLRADIPELSTESSAASPILQITTLGYDQFMADILWMEAIQYFDAHETTDRLFPDMFRKMTAITTLDPEFEYSYRFGWTVLTFFDERPEDERMEEATALLGQGWRRHPASCRMAKTMGFHYFYYLRRNATAANFLDRAATLCDFPSFYLLSARLRAQVEDEDSAILVLTQLLETTGNEHIRERIVQRINQLRTLKVLRYLRAAAKRYKTDNGGRYPSSVQELARKGYIPGAPVNPLPGRFIVNPSRGTIRHSGLKDELAVHRPNK